MSFEDWSLRVRREQDVTYKAQYVSGALAVCVQRQARLLGTWKCCPYCGCQRLHIHVVSLPKTLGPFRQ